ncbi:uncharacterized protein MCAP_0864-like [Chironomus tepperi]|uniref:uncharacterized protein MCAP_0864-like n=1 Tax=Chironomus tepperi TaxID=113505 RepID=UPI00391FB9E1
MKGNNVIVNNDTKVIIIDFSLAAKKGDIIAGHRHVGKYQPPEMFNEHEATEKIDVYSIGVCFAHILKNDNYEFMDNDYNYSHESLNEKFEKSMQLWTEQDRLLFNSIKIFIFNALSKEPHLRPSITENILPIYDRSQKLLLPTREHFNTIKSKLVKKIVSEEESILKLSNANKKLKIQYEESEKDINKKNEEILILRNEIEKQKKRIDELEEKNKAFEISSILKDEQIEQLSMKFESLSLNYDTNMKELEELRAEINERTMQKEEVVAMDLCEAIVSNDESDEGMSMAKDSKQERMMTLNDKSELKWGINRNGNPALIHENYSLIEARKHIAALSGSDDERERLGQSSNNDGIQELEKVILESNDSNAFIDINLSSKSSHENEQNVYPLLPSIEDIDKMTEILELKTALKALIDKITSMEGIMTKLIEVGNIRGTKKTCIKKKISSVDEFESFIQDLTCDDLKADLIDEWKQLPKAPNLTKLPGKVYSILTAIFDEEFLCENVLWGYPCNANSSKKEAEDYSSKISLKLASDLIDVIKAVLDMEKDDSSDGAIAAIFKNLFKNKIKRIKKDKNSQQNFHN